MRNTSELILKVIDDLERHPIMFSVEPNNFESLKHFLEGYICAIEDVSEFQYNLYYSEWINSNGKKTSLFWSDYVFHILANKEKELAYKLLIEKTKEFIVSLENEEFEIKKSGPFHTLEEAVNFKNAELMEALKGVDLKKLAER
jgi:hypothetical protein